MILRSKIY